MTRRAHGRGQKKPLTGGQPFYVGVGKRRGKERHPDRRRREVNSLKRGKP
jgi:hypothetical protein